MKILLDECVTKKVKPHLVDHTVLRVSEMKWNGLKNGELLKQAVENNFDIFLTIDKNISFQQSISKHNITLVILDVQSSNITDVLRLLKEFIKRISSMRRNEAYKISLPA